MGMALLLGSAEELTGFNRFACLSGVIQREFSALFERKPAFLWLCAPVRGESNTMNSKCRRQATHVSVGDKGADKGAFLSIIWISSPEILCQEKPEEERRCGVRSAPP